VPEAVASVASECRLPGELLLALAEVYAAQGAGSARRLARHPSALAKVRSLAEVARRIEERPELLAALGKDASAQALARARERLLFCGRYSAKEGTALDAALDEAARGLQVAAETAAQVGGPGKLPMVVRNGVFGDDHLSCRRQAFPYSPSVSASHGSSVLEARAAEGSPAVAKGALLGYLAMQGSYADDVAVFPAAAAEIRGTSRVRRCTPMFTGVHGFVEITICRFVARDPPIDPCSGRPSRASAWRPHCLPPRTSSSAPATVAGS